MCSKAPAKVLITGGHELGGVASFAAGLAAGFGELGIETEIVAPRGLLRHWRALRDPHVLKILSTTAMFAAPFAKRAICMAHGVARADVMGWPRLIGINAGYKLTNAVRIARLVAVSDYTAVQVQTSFNVRIDGVIRNPVKPIYLDPVDLSGYARDYITYVGRLVPQKNLHRILPAIRDLLDQESNLKACIIGEGPQREELELIAAHHDRIEFKGTLDDMTVREYLRKTKVFVSGNVTEGLGITYLEALSQGCVVAMPACGGGLELALEQVGRQIQLLPLSMRRGEILATLCRALAVTGEPLPMNDYSARAVALAFLDVDSHCMLALDDLPEKTAYLRAN
jgi:glycosyltransferase involved in cell wall biosynthesis